MRVHFLKRELGDHILSRKERVCVNVCHWKIKFDEKKCTMMLSNIECPFMTLYYTF